MASSLIGQLRVALSLGTAEFEAGANKAASIAKTRAKEIEGSFAGAKRSVEGLFAAFTIGLVTEQIKKSLEYAGSLAEVSRTLGVTTKDLQTFRFAATQSGVAQDQLEVGLRRLTVSMGKAELGSRDQAKAFAAIGISLDQLKGKNTGEVFRLMADGLSKVTDRSQRAAIEMTLMGRSGSTLDNLLAPGAKRLNELSEAAQRLGIVLSDSQIQGAEETAHKLEAVKNILSAQIAGVVANNATAILSLSSALATLLGEVLKFSTNPLALAVLGAGIGYRFGGLPGAAAGALGGAVLGEKAAESAADSDMDLGNRAHEVLKAKRAYEAAAAKKSDYIIGPDGLPVKVPGSNTAAAGTALAEFYRQGALYKLAKARANAPAVAPAGTDLPQIFGGKTPHAKRTPTDKNEEDSFNFAQQQRQIDLQILEAKRSLSHDYVEQTTLSIQALDVQKDITNADLDHKLAQAKRDAANGRITQETLRQLEIDTEATRSKEDTLDHLRRQAVLEAEQEQRFHDVAQLDQQQLDFRKEHLQNELALVTTAKDRRDLELKILDLDYQIQKAKLEEVIADTQATEQAKELARRALVQLNKDQGLKRQDVLNQTAGPLEQWAKSIPQTAAQINEAFQSIQAQGLEGLSSAIGDVVTGTRSLKQAFGDLARSVISDLIRMTVRMLIFRAISGVIGGKIGAPDLNSVSPVSSGLLNAPAIAPTAGFATGGSMMIGGNPGTDRNVLALNGVPIARVSRGESLNVDPNGGGGARYVINQYLSPTFAGNAATHDDLVKMAVITRSETIRALDERARRR